MIWDHEVAEYHRHAGQAADAGLRQRRQAAQHPHRRRSATCRSTASSWRSAMRRRSNFSRTSSPEAERLPLDRARFDRHRCAWRLCGRRRDGRYLPPGGHGRRHGLHGRARSRKISGGPHACRNCGRIEAANNGAGIPLLSGNRQSASGGKQRDRFPPRALWGTHAARLGQTAHFPCGGGSGIVHPCGRQAAPFPVGHQPPGELARAGRRHQAVPSPCPRPDPDRTGRDPLSHRPRSADEARKRQGPADRDHRQAERQAAHHHDRRPRPGLADRQGPGIPVALSRKCRCS